MAEPGPSFLRKTFSQALDFLLFSNVFIALCAVAQGALTYQLLGTRCDKHVLGVLFFSTLALYNFSMLLSKPADSKRSPFRRVRWIGRNYRLMITLTLAAILSGLVAMLFLSTAAQLLLVFLGAISVCYNLPLFSVGEQKFGLRNIPGLKLVLIAAVWALSTVLLPIVELSNSQDLIIPANDTLILITKRFLFIAAITIPFDIRDLYQDKSYNLKTIPVVIGEKKSQLVCQILLALYLLLLLLFTGELNISYLALAFSIFITAWLIINSEDKKDERYYFFLLDGTMILQFLLLAGTTLLK